MTTNTSHKPSALDTFNLSFEYDVTWSEAKKQTKDRTV